MSEGARGPLPHSERAALDAETLRPRPSPRAERPEGQCRPSDHDLPTDPRAAGDGVSSRVSSTAARLARMAATALSIAASSGGELRGVVVPPRTSPAMPPAVATAPDTEFAFRPFEAATCSFAATL